MPASRAKSGVRYLAMVLRWPEFEQPSALSGRREAVVPRRPIALNWPMAVARSSTKSAWSGRRRAWRSVSDVPLLELSSDRGRFFRLGRKTADVTTAL
jgi:hypothetical protein